MECRKESARSGRDFWRSADILVRAPGVTWREVSPSIGPESDYTEIA
jgi:hypothetical protein